MIGFIITCLLSLSDSIPIDNGIIGDPTVQCSSDALAVVFTTQKPFEGRVFSKGFVSQLACVGLGRGSQTPALNLSFTQCGVQRTRQLNPPGISVYTTIVVSFHKTFITKVDRAYRINCFYMEAGKTVSANLEVSMLTTTYVTSQQTMPNCRYEILRGGPTGTAVKYSKIGDMVYHKWTCDSQDVNFCMIVHSCIVEDGQGGLPFQVLDTRGCAIDKYILQNLEYPTDLMAGREAHVFKFADKPALYFSCQIQIMSKSPDAKDCTAVRPTCGEPTSSVVGGNQVTVGINDKSNRKKREKGQSRHQNFSAQQYYSSLGNFDLPRQQLVVLDIEESSGDFPSHLDTGPDSEFGGLQHDNSDAANSVCMSVPIFGFLAAALVVLFILAIILSSKFALMRLSRVRKHF